MKRSRITRAGLGLLLLAATAAPPAPRAAAVETLPAVQAIDRDLRPIRDNVQNMSVKTVRRIMGIARPRPEGEPPAATGWAASCCEENVRVLRARMTSLEKTASVLARRYTELKREDGAALARQIVDGVLALRPRVEAFASAPDQPSAATAADDSLKVVARLLKDRTALEGCCNDVEVPVGD